ncbi:hypothetical protein ACFPM3_20350 [Streptomyces coeruleoprunus]|uniref:Uncharacterized protein n=1 Tax=Streptomyces coeruleoprunus TaxID=285563 RepID=A0ABV9XIJ7_9ACTN
MDEPHSGLSHDLPEYTPNTTYEPPPEPPGRLKVYRASGCWWWEQATPEPGVSVCFGYPMPTWELALESALEYAGRHE